MRRGLVVLLSLLTVTAIGLSSFAATDSEFEAKQVDWRYSGKTALLNTNLSSSVNLDEQNMIFYSGFETDTWRSEWTVTNGGDAATYPDYTWCQSEERPDPPSNNGWSTIETDNPPFMYCWPYED